MKLIKFKNMKNSQRLSKYSTTLAILVGATHLNGCATVKDSMGINSTNKSPVGLIHNPFGDLATRKPEVAQNLILRTKKGERAVEVEIPAQSTQISDFSIPVAPAFKESNAGGRGIASVMDSEVQSGAYKTQKPTQADREIEKTFPQTRGTELLSKRSEIEKGLGLAASAEATPESDFSYLAAVDQLKAMFRSGRYEAALIETDSLIRTYPTSPQLYQMRGTLLEKVGQSDLAIKNWKQALELEPQNLSLRKFIERKELTFKHSRSIASP